MTAVPAHPAARLAPEGAASARAGVLAAQRAGTPRAFLELAAGYLRTTPGDHLVRFFVSASCARLGLRSLADEELCALPAGLQENPDARKLRAVIDALAGDAEPRAAVVARVRRQVGVLGERGVDLSRAFAAWERDEDLEILRGADGLVLTRRRMEPGVVGVVSWRDGRSEAASLVGGSTALDAPYPPPVVVEGAGAPEMLDAVWRKLHVRSCGFRPALALVVRDEGELIRAIAARDWDEMLSDERVVVFAGESAREGLDRWLRERMEFHGAALCLGGGAERPFAGPTVLETCERVNTDRRTSIAGAMARVEAFYADKGVGYWAKRFAEVDAGRGEPLRVLIPTWRVSTFMRYSAADIAEACGRRGWVARVLEQPDCSTTLSVLAYLRAADEMRPDLVVCINYPRATFKSAFPANVPWACWIQDALPVLFDAGVGGSQGPLDFLAGHLHPDLFDRYEYPRERAYSTPVLADSGKFHDGPVRADLRRRFACDVAFVSHHGEPPEQLHARIIREGKIPADLGPVLAALYPRLLAVLEAPFVPALNFRVAQVVRGVLREVLGHEPGAEVESRVLRFYATPIVERAFRHQMLGWAIDIVERHGLSLNIYGKGWGEHTRYGAFAKGPLTHGEELRAAYQSAGVQLQASISTPMHQRVIECALSGGLPLSRFVPEHLSGTRGRLWGEMMRHAPAERDDVRGTIGFAVADHPGAMAFAALQQRLGFGVDAPVARLPLGKALAYASVVGGVNEQIDPTSLLGDIGETAFASREGLEALILRSVRHRSWRDAASAMIRSRCLARFTYDAHLPRIVRFIAESLGRRGEGAA